MENNQRQDNNMESAERNNGTKKSPEVSKAPSSGTPYTTNLNHVVLDMTTRPLLHFHENILKDYVEVNPIEKRVAIINSVRAQLIETLNNLYVLENQLQDLLNRYQQFKKS